MTSATKRPSGTGYGRIHSASTTGSALSYNARQPLVGPWCWHNRTLRISPRDAIVTCCAQIPTTPFRCLSTTDAPHLWRQNKRIIIIVLRVALLNIAGCDNVARASTSRPALYNRAVNACRL